MKKFLKSKKGVSPVISTILIFSILMTGVILTYSWGLPLVLVFQDKSEVNDVENQFYELDRNIKIVTHEGDGATRSTQFEFKKGLLNYTSSSNFSLIVVSGDSPDFADPDAIIRGLDDSGIPDLGRMSYVVQSSMDDLAINSSTALTGAVDAYPILNVTEGARDAGLYPAFEEADQNQDISRIVYTRPESSFYSLYLEYRPILVITAQKSDGRIDWLDVELHLIELDNVGSFPEVGSTKIIVKRIDIIRDSWSSVSTNIQDQDQVYLYALVDGVYQQLTLDFEVTGDFEFRQRSVITQIQIYDA
ncbi:hypothetical protein [Candidatus Borrarchaeum sp.]|uniref:hypothetical protein n=1 Tax=Candidatus Borrarchaeum sp. TaxID=2846742 RepID=UPI00257EF16A|nr:hypothetical protein [Candidatus Borrarchaeum sp.]